MTEVKAKQEREKKWVAAAFTFGVVVRVLIVLFVLTAYTIEDPRPGEQFVSVGMEDYGNNESGSGDVESKSPSEQDNNDEPATSAEETVESTPTQEIVTQETSTVSTPTSPSEATQTTSNPTPDPEPEPQIDSKLDKLLGKIGESGGGPSEGKSDGDGNDGSENGQIDGKGVLQGDGIGWSLSGRGMLGKPKLNETPKKEGKVVLDIYVDRNGKVVETRRNYPASTTADTYLFELAEKAAKKATFSVKSDAPPKQKGSMTFNFKLK
ncbi:MAG: hypothetical protein HRT74_07760 [Flavobacteriales bacterium]|nr:hypothetical protein [Flavobacteriales bacterium]